ncbi:MAG: EAL domain-containing protein [Bryobacterales bacterium]|nr:EAL domain-containing protein [Bryobacterales bacterium]
MSVTKPEVAEIPSRKLIVVAIGSSAGGLEALRFLFHHLPLDSDFSYVVAQHLAPQHSSMLTDLLARETAMSVRQLNTDTLMEPACIYVTAPNTNVVFRKGFLRVIEPNDRGPKPSVDALLQSLAAEIPESAIAVILSGSGSDGSQGVRALKAAGGRVIAQDPRTSKYSGMPQAAIATGMVDAVLPPEEIGPYLIRMRDHVDAPPGQKKQKRRSSEIEQILEKINLATNIDFRGYKSNTISRRIQQRLVATRCQSLKDYISLLDANHDEAQSLAQNCLISVTSFFRDDAAFDALAAAVRNRHSGPSKEPLRVWVPGCATGEETYSLSILLSQALPGRRLQIFGTDLDENAVTFARKGLYPPSVIKSLPAAVVSKHFLETTSGFQVERAIRDSVVFARHDLLRDPLFLNLDLISCRNLLIYLKPALQEEVMRKFHYALNPNGILFLGRSENPAGEYFECFDRKARLFTNKPLLESERRLPVTRDWSCFDRGTLNTQVESNNPATFLHSLLVDQFAPPSVLIDENFRILESYGDIGRYLFLQEGKPQFTLLAMAPRAVAGSLRAQVQRTLKLQKPTRGVPRKLVLNGTDVVLQANVFPAPRATQEKLFVVSFVESAMPDEPAASQATISAENDEQMRELERELHTTREHLQAVVEELETSNEELQALNEEMQSANEELQASNEELHASNEELQSTNEELLTVNEELEHKSIELAFSIEDLENVQNSLDSPLLVIDGRGYFRHVNDDARRLFGLNTEHIGGPIVIPNESALATQIVTRAQKVSSNGQSSEFKTVVSHRHFRVCVRPYVGRHKATRGAVVVFHEITGMVQIHDRLRRADARHRVLSARQEATINALSAHMAVVDAEGNIVGINNAWKRFAQTNGYAGRRYGLGANYLAICDEGARSGAPGSAEAAEAVRSVLSGATPNVSFEYPCHSPSESRWFRCLVTAVPGERSGGAVILHVDISERIIKDQKINRQLTALDSAANAIFITDADGRIDWANQAFQRLSGYSSSELILQTPAVLEDPATRTPFAHTLLQCRRTGRPHSCEAMLISKLGEPYTVLQTITPIEGADSEWSHFVVTHEDVTEQKRAEAHMRFLAEHDELTGLRNRKSFISRLSEAIASQSESRLAVFFLDLDRFKDTNDSLGHLVGDQILQEIASRLRALFRDNATLARFGGDEFVLFVENTANTADIDFVVERLLNGFSRPLDVEGRPILITASVGVTVFPDDGRTAEDLLRNADLAMYRAKADGRRGYRFYDHRLESEVNERVNIERELSRALGARELWIAFQPQLSLQTNQIVGAESLLRWSPATDRNVPISKVISVAEESGLILNIGQWVIRESLQQLKIWLNQGHSMRISVNLSAVQFNQQDVFGFVIEMLTALNLPPSCLKAEITETVLLNRSTRVRETLHALHGAGIGLVLDDFGTGYSSLTYLQQFPIESVKIDASFLKGIGRNGNDEAIVNGIIKLAHSLGQRVVAEGVETQEQLDFLRSCDCDYAQGFLFAKPLPTQEFESYLASTAGASVN